MSLKNIYFVGNWKMNGSFNSIEFLKKLLFFAKKNEKNRNFKIILCIPSLLISYFRFFIKKPMIDLGAQNCSNIKEDYGPFTGQISPKMVKSCGANYVILGHSELRKVGENNITIKKKLELAAKNNLKVILCVGEDYLCYKKSRSNKYISNQLKVLSKKTIKNTIIAYEPIWSIGTGNIPSIDYINNIFNKIMIFTKKRYLMSPKMLYGGSVNENNINSLKNIKNCQGFLIGGSSLKYKSFTKLIKNYYK